MNRTSSVDLVGDQDTVFAQMSAATAEHAWSVPQLSEREKVYLSVVADACQPSLGLPFELHVRAGLERGVTTSDIRELLRFIAHDSGYPAALAAVERLGTIEAAIGLPRPTAAPLPAELLVTGPDAAPSPLPESTRARLRALDTHFAEHFDLQSRMRSISGQGTLTVRERAFAAMSIDVHYQTLDESFRLHIGRALGGGATPEDVRAVLRFNAQFGVTRAWRAWIALHTHLAELTQPA